MGCAPSHSSHRNHHNTSIQSYAVDDVSDLHSEDESVADKFNIKVSDVSKLPPAYKCKASVVVTTVPRPRKGCTITDVNELTFNHELLDDNNSNNNMSLQDTNSTDTTTATATTRARRRSIHEDLTRQSTQVFGQSNNTDTWDVVTDDDGHFQLKYPGPLGGWKREDKNIGYHVREIVLTHRRTLSSVHLTLGRCRTEDGGVRIPTLDDLASDVGAIPNVDKVDVVPGRGCVAYTADRLQEEGGGDDKHIEGARYVGPDGWSFFDISFVAGDEHWLELGDTFSSIHSCLILSYTVPNNAV
eukprot:PhM_4_TR9796/c0_g1_i1/m.18857